MYNSFDGPDFMKCCKKQQCSGCNMLPAKHTMKLVSPLVFQKPRWQSMNLKMHCSFVIAKKKKNETWPVNLDSTIENLWQTKCDFDRFKIKVAEIN